jgi:hypothetical protein
MSMFPVVVGTLPIVLSSYYVSLTILLSRLVLLAALAYS